MGCGAMMKQMLLKQCKVPGLENDKFGDWGDMSFEEIKEMVNDMRAPPAKLPIAPYWTDGGCIDGEEEFPKHDIRNVFKTKPKSLYCTSRGMNKNVHVMGVVNKKIQVQFNNRNYKQRGVCKRHTWGKYFKLPWEKLACNNKYKDEFQKSSGILKSFKIDKTNKDYGAYVSKFMVFVSMNPIDVNSKAIRMFEGADEFPKFKSRCEQFEFKYEKLEGGKEDSVYTIDLKSTRRVARESYGAMPLLWGDLKTDKREELSFELKDKVAFRFICIKLIAGAKDSEDNIDCFPFEFSGNYLNKGDDSQLKEYESDDDKKKEGAAPAKKKKRKGQKVMSDSDSSSSESDDEEEKKKKEEARKKAAAAPKPQTPPGPKKAPKGKFDSVDFYISILGAFDEEEGKLAQDEGFSELEEPAPMKEEVKKEKKEEKEEKKEEGMLGKLGGFMSSAADKIEKAADQMADKVADAFTSDSVEDMVMKLPKYFKKHPHLKEAKIAEIKKVRCSKCLNCAKKRTLDFAYQVNNRIFEDDLKCEEEAEEKKKKTGVDPGRKGKKYVVFHIAESKFVKKATLINRGINRFFHDKAMGDFEGEKVWKDFPDDFEMHCPINCNQIIPRLMKYDDDFKDEIAYERYTGWLLNNMFFNSLWVNYKNESITDFMIALPSLGDVKKKHQKLFIGSLIEELTQFYMYGK